MPFLSITIMDIKDLSVGSLDYSLVGFQATKLSQAVEIIKEMKKQKAKVFLSFTSNLVASGLRGIIRDLCKEKFVDVIITAGGSIDHDLIKSYVPYELGDFFMDDAALHKKGTNRLGNILVKNKCYVELEKRMQPVFEKLYNEKKICSPSELIYEVGNAAKEDSFLYWCSKNSIPVFCPGITDSAIGLQTYFYKQKRKDFGIDVTKDMGKLAQIVLDADKTGGIVLGGGISKHHTIGVNLLRGGLDYAVYVTTATPWDGSLSGARTSEAVSWGKIGEKAKSVTVDCDATIAFPLLMKMVKG